MIYKNKIIFIFIIFLLLVILFPSYEYFIQIPKELYFIHIPKNAGKSIENSAKKNNIIWGEYEYEDLMNEERKAKSSIGCNYWHTPLKYFKNNYNEKKLFTVIRNPYNRIISEFKYQNRHTPGKINKVELNNFVSSLKKNISENKFKNDCHLLKQIEFIQNEDGVINKNIEILRFENLDEDFYNLLKKNNNKLFKLEKTNVSSSNLSINDLSEESKKNIKEIYKEDFEYFNYKF
jgi:hypothetical protein